MNLSKSRYCYGIQCPKILWLKKYKPEVMEQVDNSAIMEQGNAVHEVARYLFGEHINIEYTDNLSEMIKDTYRTIESYKDVIITEASFDYDHNFCSVDILKKKGDNYEIYEVKSSTLLKDVYINDASYQYYVLSNLGFKVTKCSVIVINNKYERIGDIELDKLFLINDITSDVLALQDTVKENIKKINDYLASDSEEKRELDNYCLEPYLCAFFSYCSRNLPKPNVFDLAADPGKKVMALYKEGYVSYKDLLEADINDKQRQTIEYNLYDKPDYIDKDKIKEFLDTLPYPIYYLDFETYQLPIPLYDRVIPYDPIPFQYSLHYELTEDSETQHKEFLGKEGTDPRRALAEQLVKDIPRDVTVLAYHMSYEKGRIKRLAEIFPDLSDHLMNIYDNIKDLEIPFSKRYYYTKAMGASSSIKKVLPALFPNDPELDYHNLELIHNGSEAMNSFRAMENMNKEELEYTRDRLLKYCCLDTYAMVKIYHKLREVIK